MEELPLEIVLDIFYRLPAETIVQCKSVCKYWLSIILNGDGNGDDEDDHGNYFANMHLRGSRRHHLDSPTLNFIDLFEFKGERVADFHIREYEEEEDDHHQIINFPVSYKYCIGWRCDRRIAGSCNGLVCLPRTFGIAFLKDAIGICNPLLKEYVTLPLSDKHLQSGFMSRRDIRLGRQQLRNPYLVAVGFGYLPCTDEYKVVRVDYPNPNTGEVEVYTFGGGKSINGGVWRSRGTIDYRLLSFVPLLMNGSLHWLARNQMLPRGDQKHRQIASFNLKAEAFRMIPIPHFPPVISSDGPKLQLKDLGGGCLCLIRKEAYGMDIWVLKDYMDTESWVKEFSIKWEGIEKSWCYSPCAIKKKKNDIDDDDHEILLLCDGKSGLVSYDPKTQSFEDVGGGGGGQVDGVRHVSVCIDSNDPVHHTNSIISLKALGEERKNPRKKKIVESSWTKRKIIQSIIVKAKAYAYQKGRGIYPNLFGENVKQMTRRKKTTEVSWTKRKIIQSIIVKAKAYQKGRGIYPNFFGENLKQRIRKKKTVKVSWTRRRTIRSMILRIKARVHRRWKKEKKEKERKRKEREALMQTLIPM